MARAAEDRAVRRPSTEASKCPQRDCREDTRCVQRGRADWVSPLRLGRLSDVLRQRRAQPSFRRAAAHHHCCLCFLLCDGGLVCRDNPRTGLESGIWDGASAGDNSTVDGTSTRLQEAESAARKGTGRGVPPPMLSVQMPRRARERVALSRLRGQHPVRPSDRASFSKRSEADHASLRVSGYAYTRGSVSAQSSPATTCSSHFSCPAAFSGRRTASAFQASSTPRSAELATALALSSLEIAGEIFFCVLFACGQGTFISQKVVVERNRCLRRTSGLRAAFLIA